LVVRLARRNDRSPRRVRTVVGVAGLAYVAVAGVAFAFTLDDRLFALAAVAWALFGGAVLAGVLVVLAAVNGHRPPGSALPPPQPRQRVG
jgi:Na+/proline symporter